MESSVLALTRRQVFSGVNVVVEGLNWLFLTESITVAIVVIFYLFYLSRLLGSLVATLLTWLYLWPRHNVYLDIESIQFSPLGGRISFKDVRYVSRNQSLRIQTGHFTLRYWFWRTCDSTESNAKRTFPCRIKIEVQGLEWFVYNRTPSYDAIIDHLADHADEPITRKKTRVRLSSQRGSNPQTVAGGAGNPHASLDAWWIEFLPIKIVCHTGAIILGNRAMPNILIAGFDKVEGTYSVAKSRSVCDFFKEVYDFQFSKAKAVWRTNIDHDESILQHGSHLYQEFASDSKYAQTMLSQGPEILQFPRFNRLVRTLQGFRLSAIQAKSATHKSSKHWEGLARYKLDHQAHDPEYARVNTLLECPTLRLIYYADSAGLVPDTPIAPPSLAGHESTDIGNGDLAPEWGVDVEITGGTVNYGPWTERQRVALQSVFTPTAYHDVQPTEKLLPGEIRRHQALKIFIEFSDHTKVRIPTREPSKDWQWDRHHRNPLAPLTVRHYGWLDAYLGGHSSINMALPLVADEKGYELMLEVHIDSLAVFCSLAPDAPIIQSQTCRVSVQLPTPLEWSGVRPCTIAATLNKTNIRMLREYMNLFGDIVKDMTSGPSGDIETFVPMAYRINIQLKEYSVQLYLNEHNVVTVPGVEEDNSMLHLTGEAVNASILVSSERHQPSLSQVNFQVLATPIALSITVPLWNTHASFSTPRTTQFGIIGDLRLDGSYAFHLKPHPDNVETCYINIETKAVRLKCMGWCIRYLINIRDNYFGNFTHRLTAQEFAQQRPRRTDGDENERYHHHKVGDPIEQKYRPGNKDTYEVLVSVQVLDSVLIFPDSKPQIFVVCRKCADEASQRCMTAEVELW